MAARGEEVWITGIGLVSSLGDGHEAHWRALGAGGTPEPVVDDASFAPYPVHPLVDLDYSRQIPRRGDQRQMGPWQRLGTYAAGLALSDAGLAGDADGLDKTNMIVAAGSGERDTEVDAAVLDSIAAADDPEAFLNETLQNGLRPTLFLAQLSNLLAGNISIVHKVAGSSRTFMGEEMAGVSAVQVALRRIETGQGELFLVGGAYAAEREDLLLQFELGRRLWAGPFAPVWQRRDTEGGFVPGSVGAFLVLESKGHAAARGAPPYARLGGVLSDRCNRLPGQAGENARRQFAALSAGLAPGPLAVVSGASGIAPATGEELEFLKGLASSGFEPAIRASGSVLGHAIEAQFPAALALAAMAVANATFYDPFDESGIEMAYTGPVKRAVATTWGQWRGEGLALLEAIH